MRVAGFDSMKLSFSREINGTRNQYDELLAIFSRLGCLGRVGEQTNHALSAHDTGVDLTGAY